MKTLIEQEKGALLMKNLCKFGVELQIYIDFRALLLLQSSPFLSIPNG